MAVVTIQVGQCGNQIGYAFYEQLIQEIETSSELIQEKVIETYFQRDFDQGKLVANSVLIDMEPKVVQKCLKDS